MIAQPGRSMMIQPIRACLLATSCILVLHAQALADKTPQPTVLPKKTIDSFLQKSCVRCHGPKVQKGKLRLDELPREIADGTTAQRWQDVLDALNAGDMPPDDEPQPSNGE
ncbi:MAG: hypothetical protein N2C14_15180, partial [Planctomycetales bacterium]